MVLQEKQFKAAKDKWGNPWDLWYPSVYPDDPDDGATLPLPYPSCVPEFFGDTTIINGAICPHIVVKPQFQRFRILNGAQSRFYNLRLFYEKDGKQADLSRPGPDFTVIGTEGGFLPQPVRVSSATPTGYVEGEENTVAYHLLLGPAERVDFIVDLRNYEGKRFVLYNDAPGPFPDGDPVIDNGTGMTPDTANLLEIIVANVDGANEGSDNVNFVNNPILPLPTNSIKPIVKTLNEDFDPYGRLIQRLGTDHGLRYLDPVTEFGAPDEVQVWDIYNTTADTHPIHFHLFNVQILGRARFNRVGQAIGRFVPPDAYEMGWKETVRMNPGTVTRVALKFDIPPMPKEAPPVPVSPRLGTVTEKGKTYGFYEYVWHCHILEHEEHDMMRPLAVKVPL